MTPGHQPMPEGFDPPLRVEHIRGQAVTVWRWKGLELGFRSEVPRAAALGMIWSAMEASRLGAEHPHTRSRRHDPQSRPRPALAPFEVAPGVPHPDLAPDPA